MTDCCSDDHQQTGASLCGRTRQEVTEHSAPYSAGSPEPGTTESYFDESREDQLEPEQSGSVVRATDTQIIELVRREGPHSRAAASLEKSLQDLGIGTLTKWSSQELLLPRLRRRQIYLPAPPLSYKREARTLIYISVRDASPIFMIEYIFGDKWVRGRASLHTCFVNACLCRFAKEFRRYCREERPSLQLDDNDSDTGVEPDGRYSINQRMVADPLGYVLAREEIESVLLSAGLAAADMMMFIRTSQGFSQKEIGDELGLTESAVSTRMRRNRIKIAEHRRDHGTDGTTF